MYFFINRKIADTVEKNIGEKQYNNKVILKIEGFSDANIYKNIAFRISNLLTQKHLRYCIKISKLEFDRLVNLENNTPGIFPKESQNDFLKYDYVANESITYYRNSNEYDVLVFLGTENEDDSSGLANIKTITPNDIHRELYNAKDDSYDYAKLIDCDENDDVPENFSKVVNKLYNDLFFNVPFDFCKLVRQLQEFSQANYQDNLESNFIYFFYDNLAEWGLCYQNDDLPEISEIIGTKSNLLSYQQNFISRKKDFKQPSSRQLAKMESNINDFKNKLLLDQTLNEKYNSMLMPEFSNVDDYCSSLKEYIVSGNLQELKRLQKVNFSIVKEIFKTEKTQNNSNNDKKENNIVTGNPFNVFIGAVSDFLIARKEKLANQESILFLTLKFNKIILHVDNNDYSLSILKSNWNKLCVCTCGILDYINEFFVKNNISLNISFLYEDESFDPINSFEILNKRNLFKNQSKPFNELDFSIGVGNLNGIVPLDFRWKFSNKESWYLAFSPLVEKKFIDDKNLYEYFDADFDDNSSRFFCPIFFADNLNSVANCKDQEEFFERYSEFNIICKNYFNMLSADDVFASLFNQQFVSDFFLITKKFFRELIFKGFYSLLCNDKIIINDFINRYNQILEYLKNNYINDTQQKYILIFFENLFLLNNYDRNSSKINSTKELISFLFHSLNFSIVNPWHPVTLEKILKQHEFVLLSLCEDFKQNKLNVVKHHLETLNSIVQFPYLIDVLYSELKDISPVRLVECSATYNWFSIYDYNKDNTRRISRMKDVLKREKIFDEDYRTADTNEFNDNAKMIFDMLMKYIDIFQSFDNNLSLVFINPNELQPIIAAVKQYIDFYTRKYKQNAPALNISIKILFADQIIGGKNYLKAWLDEYLDIDENIKIKTYINSWNCNTYNNISNSGLSGLIGNNNDIIFVMGFLKSNSFEFKKDVEHSHNDNFLSLRNGTKASYYLFPIVEPVSYDSFGQDSREITITHKEFRAAYLHSQIVSLLNNSNSRDNGCILAKTVSINDSINNFLVHIHDNANFVVCIDQNIDAQFFKIIDNKYFSLIGYSTGNGDRGNFNLTISTRKSIQESLISSFKHRFSQLFNWQGKILNEATIKAFEFASKLDGISIFTAIKSNNYNINEFLAYLFTALYHKKINNDKDSLQVLIHLDSFKHWFNKSERSCSGKRPDFLLLSVKNSENNNRLIIDAKVIECKIAAEVNMDVHFVKGEQQVDKGISDLKLLFDPENLNSESKYWFAQLYKALNFAQISFNDNNFNIHLEQILFGNFDINWTGSVYGYCLDLDGNMVNSCVESYKYPALKFPQVYIKNLLLEHEDSDQQYNNVPKDLFDVDDVESKQETYDVFSENFNKVFIESHVREPQKLVPVNDDNMISAGNIAEGSASSLTPAKTGNEQLIIDQPGSVQELPVITDNNKLEKIRVLIGKDSWSKDIYWEFGNKALSNRHLLITGASGQGKTYCIQSLLYEIEKNNIPVIIFDYSNSFSSEQLNPTFKKLINGKFDEHIIANEGFPLNPFKVFFKEEERTTLENKQIRQREFNIQTRVSDIFAHVYNFGDQQKSVINAAIKRAYKNHGSDIDFDEFRAELESSAVNKVQQTVVSKLSTMFDWLEIFEGESKKIIDWNKIIYSEKGRLTVFQLDQISDDLKKIFVEIFLWDLWNYVEQNDGKESMPFCVVLDEAQNLDFSEKSPSKKILTEGRKFGWSAWFATQSLNVLNDDEVTRLNQSSTKIYFKPVESEFGKISKLLDVNNPKGYLSEISNLSKGNAMVVADQKQNDKLINIKPRKVKIISLDDRKLRDSNLELF